MYFLAGNTGILDTFHFTQPVIACTYIGLDTGNLAHCLVLGGQLQNIATHWAKLGAAVAPDAHLASVHSAIILVLGGQGTKGVSSAIAIAVPLAVAGLLHTTLVRTLATAIVTILDRAATTGSFGKIHFWQWVAITLQGLRIAIPAGLILAVGAGPVRDLLTQMPHWLTTGLGLGGGLVVAVGYAMVIKHMATRTVWHFFAIGFVLATVKTITHIGLGAIGISLAHIYLDLSKQGGGSGNGGSLSGAGHPVGTLIHNYY